MSELYYKQFFDPKIAVKKGNEAAILKMAALLTAQAKSLAPVDMGQLRNSIMYRTPAGEGGFNDGGRQKSDRKIDSRPSPGSAFVGINLDYAIYQEFGTRKMKAQPYMRPAIALVVYGRAKQVVAEEINREVAFGSLSKQGAKGRVKFY